MDETPARYSDVCKKALETRDNLDLTDTQTLLYNHICQGDFYLFGDDGQSFYDSEHNGFGWSDSMNWTKKQMKRLVDNGLVAHTIEPSPRDGRYKHHHWHDPEYDLKDLINAACYVSAWKLFMLRHYLNLPAGFDRKIGKYGKLELIYGHHSERLPYGFKYNGVLHKSNDRFNMNNGVPFEMSYETFADMIHPLWDTIREAEGFEEIEEKSMTSVNVTNRRLFTLQQHGVCA